MEAVSTTSPVRYPGGKFRARKILTNYIPDEATRIVAPFFGGGSFELHLTGSNKQVTGFDGFPLLAVFWECMLEDPTRLAKLIEAHLGTVTGEKFKQLQKRLKAITEYSEVDDRFEIAADFFIVNRCSFSGATLSGGYSRESSTTRFTQSSIDRVRNFKNNNLDVRYGLFEETLKLESLESVTADFLFLDPPYLLDSGKNSLYGIGGDLHKTFNHALLKEMVVNSGLLFTLTYNNTDGIRDLWKDFNIYDAEWAYGMNASKKSSEIVITNHDAKP